MKERSRGGCSRRTFVVGGARVLATIAGGLLLGSRCSRGPSGPPPAERAKRYDASLDCTDTSDLWPAEVATREENDYTDRSTKNDQYCFNCSNFVPPETRGTCGTCDTVKGPIHPLGWCEAWTENRG